MEVTYCGIGDITFVAEDSTYVGDVIFQTDDDRLSGGQRIASHVVKINVRVPGKANLKFEEIQAAMLSVANEALTLASSHIRDASLSDLERHNREMDARSHERISSAVAED
jgi:hypothetical protein